MQVFITGVTGHIGGVVLEAFMRAGHSVSALVRDPAKAELVARRGAQPVLGELSKINSYMDAAAQASVIVHIALDRSSRGPEIDRKAVAALLEAAARRSASQSPAAFVYTSDVRVLGETTTPAGEDAAVNPTPLVAWRPAHEQMVMDACRRGVRTAVVRPGIVYGGTSGIVADLVKDAANGLVRVIGDGSNRWPCVYVRDLADLYVRVGTHPDAAGIFHANDEADERVEDIVESIAGHTRMRPDVRHVPLPEARSKMGKYADALALDQRVRSPRARMLGWSPTLHSVAGNVARLLEEFRTQREAA